MGGFACRISRYTSCVFTRYQEVITKADKWIHLCAPYISMFYDLCYKVRDTLSADLCQGHFFSKQFSIF